MGQDVFLAGQHSLRLTRSARRDSGLLLVPAPGEHLRTDQTAIDLPSLRASLPEILLPIAPGAPLEMTFFSREATGIRGLRQARRVAALVQDGAGSPEETLLSFAFKLPPELGGIETPPFSENEPIEWPSDVLHLIEHRRMRPDFHWSRHRTASEYNGKEHVSEGAFEEDQRRVRDYQTCGISVFPASYRNVSTLPALNAYLARVAHALAQTEGAEFEARVRRTLADEGASFMRRVLLSQMLPAVPSEKPDW